MKREIWVMIAWLCGVGCNTWANDFTMWHHGQLVLQNGTELNGDLNYNWRAQIVQCRQGIIIKAYSANQIQGFAYFDDLSMALRKFVPVDYPVKSGRHRLHILEEVVSGPVLVYREYNPGFELIKAHRPSAYSSDANIDNDLKKFSYLVGFDDELMDMNVFYQKVWPHIKAAFALEYKQSASLPRAELTGIAGQIRMICWYNGLTQKRLSSSSIEPNNVPLGEVSIGQ